MTRISLYKEDFQKAVLKVSGVVGKTLKPILEGMKIEVTDNKVVFTATDMESTIQYEPKFSFAEGEAFVVNAKDLAEIAKNLVPGDVILEANDTLKITNGNGVINLPLMNVEDYPEIDSPLKNDAFIIDKHILTEGIDDVFCCAASDEYLKNLACVHFEISRSNLRLVAADGFRLAYNDNYISASDNEFEFSLSVKAVKAMLSIVNDFVNDNVSVFYSPKNVSIASNDVCFSTRILDVPYVDYERIIPEKFDTEAVFSKQLFLSNLKFVNVVGKKSGESVLIEFLNNECELTVRAIGVGEAKTKFPAMLEGESVKNAYNPKFLFDAIAKINDTVCMKFLKDSNKPCIIQDASKNHSCVQVIMPLKMRDQNAS